MLMPLDYSIAVTIKQYLYYLKGV